MNQIQKIVTRYRISSACLALVDINHFKKINDTYCHAQGVFTLMSLVVEAQWNADKF
ncbi:diguanylate cyclase [Vibrio sp. 99-70-13A1]|nr:diguanylate cyclase [Vibrio sp. 99-70-13A1]